LSHPVEVSSEGCLDQPQPTSGVQRRREAFDWRLLGRLPPTLAARRGDEACRKRRYHAASDARNTPLNGATPSPAIKTCTGVIGFVATGGAELPGAGAALETADDRSGVRLAAGEAAAGALGEAVGAADP